MQIRVLTLLTTFVLFFGGLSAQEILKKNIQKKWVKTELRMADGSKVFRPDLLRMQLQYKFLPNDSLQITLDGRTYFEKYRLQDSVLSYKDIRFRVKEVSDVKLVIKELSPKEENEEIEIEFIPQHLYDLGFEPITYFAKNGDEVFIAAENHVYPYFVNAQYPAIAFVSEKFDFPEWRRGNFLARFIVNKKGELYGVRVEESTNLKYDQKLVNAIKKTAGMWRPAEFNGKPVTTEVVMEFKMDFPKPADEESPEIKMQLSMDKLTEGNYFVEEKLYRMAVSAYTDAIEYDFKNVEAYYRRAAAYVMLRDKKKACEDYEQLKYLQQVKATELYDKYCDDAKSTQKSN